MEAEKFNALVNLLAESWRLNQFTKNLPNQIADEKLQKKIANQALRFDKHLRVTAEIFGLEVLDFTGAEYETGLPIAPINLADFATEENLIVEAMIEPTIKIAGTAEIVKCGAAVLGGRVK